MGYSDRRAHRRFRRSAAAGRGHRRAVLRRPDRPPRPARRLRRTAWRHLEDAGLTRLTSDPESGGGPAEVALVLRALARHAVTVPLAETDVLAGWLAARGRTRGSRRRAADDRDRPMRGRGDCSGVPYARDADAVVVLALRDGARCWSGGDRPPTTITTGHNLGGEPRDTLASTSPPRTSSLVDARRRTDPARRLGAVRPGTRRAGRRGRVLGGPHPGARAVRPAAERVPGGAAHAGVDGR